MLPEQRKPSAGLHKAILMHERTITAAYTAPTPCVLKLTRRPTFSHNQPNRQQKRHPAQKTHKSSDTPPKKRTTATMADNNTDNKALSTGRAREEGEVRQMQMPTNTAAGMMGMVQHMLGAMQGNTAVGQQEQQAGGGGGPPTTYVPLDPGSLMQSSMMTGGGETRTAVGADPNAHTSQTFDPATNTLITTTTDPVTGATRSSVERASQRRGQSEFRVPAAVFVG